MMSNTLNEFTMAMVMTTVVMGASMGNFTCTKVCHLFAPSMMHASMGSRGMVTRPMRNITMFVPSCCQVHAKIIEKVFRGTLVRYDGFSGMWNSASTPL